MQRTPKIIQIVGAGGIGGWVGKLVAKTFRDCPTVEIFDKDIWEERNVDRQFAGRLGGLKAQTLAEELPDNGKAYPEWFVASTHGLFMYPIAVDQPNRIVFACVDNHPARLQVLDSIDLGAETDMAIICGNEYVDASACVYFNRFKGTRKDPRVRYPEMLTDHSGDPSSPCTGPAQEASPQLAISNCLAASYGMWLAWFWLMQAPDLHTEAAKKASPVEIRSSVGYVTVLTEGDYDAQ
jgi:hypothetical protein